MTEAISPGGPVVRVVVLAAGAGRRFGGQKLLARLDGRPILRHVLDALAAAGVDAPIVVIRPRARAVPALLAGRGAEVVVNPTPEAGLASSLRVGWAAAFGPRTAGTATKTRQRRPAQAVLIVLGDQPRLRPAIVRRLLDAPLDPDHPFVAPRYAVGGGRNPMRIDRSGESLVLATTGDRGLGPLLDARPELVRSIDVPGDNPDVDRRSDLAALAARGGPPGRGSQELT